MGDRSWEMGVGEERKAWIPTFVGMTAPLHPATKCHDPALGSHSNDSSTKFS